MIALEELTMEADATERATIVVPAGGIAVAVLVRRFGLNYFDDVRPLFGTVLGHPRDYVETRHGEVLNVGGVRRLVECLRLAADVEAEPDTLERAIARRYPT